MTIFLFMTLMGEVSKNTRKVAPWGPNLLLYVGLTYADFTKLPITSRDRHGSFESAANFVQISSYIRYGNPGRLERSI